MSEMLMKVKEEKVQMEGELKQVKEYSRKLESKLIYGLKKEDTNKNERNLL